MELINIIVYIQNLSNKAIYKKSKTFIQDFYQTNPLNIELIRIFCS